MEIARGVGDVELEAGCNSSLCLLGSLAAEPELGRAAAGRAVELGERLGAFSRVAGFQALGLQQVLDGQADQAVHSLEDALSLCATGARSLTFEIRAQLAQAHLGAGNVAQAREIAEEALTLSLAAGARLAAIDAALALSAALRAGAVLAAAARIEEVLATADRLIAETGACNLTPCVDIDRAAWAALRGDAGQEGDYLRRAHAAFVRMGATGHARATAAVLRRRDVTPNADRPPYP